MQLTAIGFISQLKTIRAALETIPPERHQDFIQRIREERGIGIVRQSPQDVLQFLGTNGKAAGFMRHLQFC